MGDISYKEYNLYLILSKENMFISSLINKVALPYFVKLDVQVY